MSGRIFFLDLGAGRVLSARPDGSDLTALVSTGRTLPDGLVVDAARGHLYWTNMGNPKKNDGSIVRSDLDGGNVTVIVPAGATFTPKQLQLDARNGKLYWSDREGMRVMRSNLDGSRIETLVQSGESDDDRLDARNWCVGIALDLDRGKIYWTQKGADNAGQGRIFRANIDLLPGEVPRRRSDIEVLFSDLPEPIDLDLDPGTRVLYWTDRGDPPRGNTVSRAPIDQRAEPEIVVTHLMEAIGLVLYPAGNCMFMTDLAGSVYRANLDGSDLSQILMAQGNLSGIAYLE